MTQFGAAPPVLTFQQFAQELQAQFVPRDGARAARDKLSTFVQRGPVSSYADEFLKLALAAPNMAEAEKLNQFLRGLKTRVRVEVELKDPGSLQEAIRMAERVDAAYYSRVEVGTGFRAGMGTRPGAPSRHLL